MQLKNIQKPLGLKLIDKTRIPTARSFYKEVDGAKTAGSWTLLQ